MEFNTHPRVLAQKVVCPTCEADAGTQCYTKPGMPVPGFGISSSNDVPIRTPKAHDSRCIAVEVAGYREEVQHMMGPTTQG